MQQSALQRFATGAQTTKERLLRAAAGGTFLDEPPQPAPDAPGYRSESTGKFVGYGIDEHQATRSRDTGRITDIGEPEPVPRSTLTARYGPPDGGRRRREANNVAAEGQGVLLDEEAETGLDSRGIADEIVTAGAADRDVSLAPDEANRGVGAVGANTLGSFNAREGRQGAPRNLQDPPEPAVRDQGRTTDIERNERAAERAGVLEPSGDPFDIAESTRRGVLSEDEIETLSDEFETATESFDEIDATDADDFLDEAAFRKSQAPSIETGDTLAVNTTNTLLESRRSDPR